MNEQKEGEGVLLYHATCSPPESFVNGINPARAKGFGQGEGFYFFTKKTRAVNHANDLIKGSVDKEEAVDCSGGAHIVISDEPVTPETFDIDYEAYAGGFSEFVIKNKEYFEPRKDNYGLGIRKIFDHPTRPSIAIYLRPDKKGSLSIGVGSATNPNSAVLVSQMAKDLAKENPEMFKKFEQEILPKAAAIKYNGKEKIIPLRIEDLEGNVVWSRK